MAGEDKGAYIEITLNDRLGTKCRLKCQENDTVGDVKKIAATKLGTRPERMKFQKQHQVLRDHIMLSDYEVKNGSEIELFYQ